MDVFLKFTSPSLYSHCGRLVMNDKNTLKVALKSDVQFNVELGHAAI